MPDQNYKDLTTAKIKVAVLEEKVSDLEERLDRLQKTLNVIGIGLVTGLVKLVLETIYKIK